MRCAYLEGVPEVRRSQRWAEHRVAAPLLPVCSAGGVVALACACGASRSRWNGSASLRTQTDHRPPRPKGTGSRARVCPGARRCRQVRRCWRQECEEERFTQRLHVCCTQAPAGVSHMHMGRRLEQEAAQKSNGKEKDRTRSEENIGSNAVA